MKNTDLEQVENRIVNVRGQKVLLDRDLAEMYGVTTAYLKRQVKRNIERFPEDFMFELTKDEEDSLRCQIGTLKRGAHSKYLPFAFTEQGVAMLSGVLNSPRAIQVNIAIMRAFIKLKRLSAFQKELVETIREHDERLDTHDVLIMEIVGAMKKLSSPQPAKSTKKKIGF